MKNVKVKKDQLLSTLEANAATHKADFEIAYQAFSDRLRENLESRLKSIKAGKTPTQEDLWINLEVPQDHSEDYTRAREMLEWEIKDEVELSEQEFRQYVQDIWSWKGKFSMDNSYYTGAASPSSAIK